MALSRGGSTPRPTSDPDDILENYGVKIGQPSKSTTPSARSTRPKKKAPLTSQVAFHGPEGGSPGPRRKLGAKPDSGGFPQGLGGDFYPPGKAPGRSFAQKPKRPPKGTPSPYDGPPQGLGGDFYPPGQAPGQSFAAPPGGPSGPGAPPGAPVGMVVDDPDAVYADFYDWSEKELDSFRSKLIEAGLAAPTSGVNDLYSAWRMLVDHSLGYQGKGRKITPYDVLAMYPSVVEDPNYQYFTGKKVRTDKRTLKVEQKTAEGAVRDILQELMGRDPNSSELKRLTGSFQNYFAQRPEVTRTTQQFKMGELTGSTEEELKAGGTVEGGVEDLEQGVQETDEYGAYQAASTYYNALQQMFGAL